MNRNGTAHHAFANRIRQRFEDIEIRRLRALGHNWLEAYQIGWAAGDEVYHLALADDRDVQFLGLRIIHT